MKRRARQGFFRKKCDAELDRDQLKRRRCTHKYVQRCSGTSNSPAGRRIMNKPFIKPDPDMEFTPATDSIVINTPVRRLESIIADAQASGKSVNKHLAAELRDKKITKVEALETLMYAVALGGSSGNATFH